MYMSLPHYDMDQSNGLKKKLVHTDGPESALGSQIRVKELPIVYVCLLLEDTTSAVLLAEADVTLQALCTSGQCVYLSEL